MSVTRTLSNKFKFELGKGSIDFSAAGAGAFRVILMKAQADFTFNRDTMGTYDDVDDDELATANGYTQLDEALVIDSVWAQNDTDNKAEISWNNVTWTADGDSIGPTSAAIILQYDAGNGGDDSLVVGCINFGEDITITDGVSFQLQNMGFDLTQGA